MVQKSISILKKGVSSEIKKDGFSLDLEGINNWLLLKGIISDSCKLLYYQDISEWTRGGAETYISVFEIGYLINDIKQNKKVILKALTTIPVEHNLKVWGQRRNILSNNNIPVSNWFWSGNGLIIEEFYPFEYHEYSDFDKIIEIAYVLDKLGFSCLNFLKDLRCDHKGNLYFVDFGFDLGEPSYFGTNKNLNHLKKKFSFKLEEIEYYIRSKFNKK